MAYFPASCDQICEGCSQNKCGWCAFHDCPCEATLKWNTNLYDYSTTIGARKEE